MPSISQLQDVGRCRRLHIAIVGILAATLMTAEPGAAQQPPAPGKAATSAPAKSAKAAPAARPAEPGEASLRQRVEQLEEQLVDLQVVIGTLESLAKSGGGGSAALPPGRTGAAFTSSADTGRLDSMETQIRALTAQVEQLADQIRSGGARGGVAPAGRPVASAPIAGFGSTTVQQGDTLPPLAAAPPARGPEAAPAPSGPPADPAGAKPLYEQAYGYLLQQDYGAAESAFQDFLQKYPTDPLAGNAQYWLGESYFVRGNYRTAASAFLKGYQQYGRSVKAPDSLLKLAMSLDRLGQRDAACSSFGELSTRFPQAPAHVRTRADSERRRLGCG
jgi:tol-pal system protein YbgF